MPNLHEHCRKHGLLRGVWDQFLQELYQRLFISGPKRTSTVRVVGSSQRTMPRCQESYRTYLTIASSSVADRRSHLSIGTSTSARFVREKRPINSVVHSIVACQTKRWIGETQRSDHTWHSDASVEACIAQCATWIYSKCTINTIIARKETAYTTVLQI